MEIHVLPRIITRIRGCYTTYLTSPVVSLLIFAILSKGVVYYMLLTNTEVDYSHLLNRIQDSGITLHNIHSKEILEEIEGRIFVLFANSSRLYRKLCGYK